MSKHTPGRTKHSQICRNVTAGEMKGRARQQRRARNAAIRAAAAAAAAELAKAAGKP